MAGKSNTLNENRPDFTCRAKGDIVINKIEEMGRRKFKEPYLFKN